MPDGPIRLLYIDDDDILCALVAKEFERGGYRVETAREGASGLARLTEGGIDVVALDHHMPGMSGLEILDAITKLADPPPAVYVTGELQGKVAVAALKAGAADYVIKDASGEFLTLLKASIAGAVEATRTRRAKEQAERELRASRDRFEALAAERELLIREVNHRVANSLQMVSGFLRLQMNAAPSPETRDALSAAIARVDAIGNVHKQLHASSTVNMVELPVYLEHLIVGMGKGVAGVGSATRLSVQAEPIVTSTGVAMSIGLVATELVINALKHAFPAGGTGHIRVGCVRAADGALVLSVEDDGKGMAASRAAGQSAGAGSGLGQRIIAMLAAKLRAEVKYEDTGHGTRVTMIVPAQESQIETAA